VGLRPYVLWRRFLRVWELLMGGASLTSAAHAAGFADAAHLTRTSRTMFGFPPSAMQMVGPLRPAPPHQAGASPVVSAADAVYRAPGSNTQPRGSTPR
jgi:AraC-like DNA-binding protein